MEVKPISGSPRLISLQIAEGAFSVIRSAAFCLYLSILVNDEVIKVTEHVLEVVLEPLQAGSLAEVRVRSRFGSVTLLVPYPSVHAKRELADRVAQVPLSALCQPPAPWPWSGPAARKGSSAVNPKARSLSRLPAVK